MKLKTILSFALFATLAQGSVSWAACGFGGCDPDNPCNYYPGCPTGPVKHPSGNGFNLELLSEMELAPPHMDLTSAGEQNVFTGHSYSRGNLDEPCADVPNPSQTAAEADADQQASSYCQAEGLISKRILEFTDGTYYGECSQGGPGYRVASKMAAESAKYECTNAL